MESICTKTSANSTYQKGGAFGFVRSICDIIIFCHSNLI